MAGFLIGLLNVLLVISSLFLICLVLIQRGKGGGLAGAFGGPGGSSAFGTKAGDIFTKITIITAGIWFLLTMLQVILINKGGSGSAFQGGPSAISELPVSDDVTGAAPNPFANHPSGTTGLAPETGTAPSAEKGLEGLPSAIGTEPAAAPAPATTPAPDAGWATNTTPTPTP